MAARGQLQIFLLAQKLQNLVGNYSNCTITFPTIWRCASEFFFKVLLKFKMAAMDKLNIFMLAQKLNCGCCRIPALLLLDRPLCHHQWHRRLYWVSLKSSWEQRAIQEEEMLHTLISKLWLWSSWSSSWPEGLRLELCLITGCHHLYRPECRYQLEHHLRHLTVILGLLRY